MTTATTPDVLERLAERAKVLLDLIYDEVDQRLNPDDDECWHCGGEGYIADCFDGFCVDAESGCDDCTRRCPECARNNYQRLKAVREEVIKSGDIDLAREWLKTTDRWSDDITPEQIKEELARAKAALAQESGR